MARVETKLTFVNQLVGALTLGIYTPMQIIVTCAAGSSGSAQADEEHRVEVASEAKESEIINAFAAASDIAVSTGKPAYVIFKNEQDKKAEAAEETEDDSCCPGF